MCVCLYVCKESQSCVPRQGPVAGEIEAELEADICFSLQASMRLKLGVVDLVCSCSSLSFLCTVRGNEELDNFIQ